MAPTLARGSLDVYATGPTVKGDAADKNSAWQAGGLSSRLGALRTRCLWTDCELVVGASATRVTAHRVVLAAASPVLAAMLYGPLAPSDRPLALPDLEPEVFDLLLKYMYTDDITLNSCDVACSLYQAAHYLILPQVETVCKTFLINNLTPESVLSIYEFAQLFEEKEVSKKCLELMASETAAVLNGPNLEAARVETLVHLFSLPDLALGSELDLFKAAERWVHAGPVLNQENSETESETADAKPGSFAANNDGDRKKLIQVALKQIRFLSMDPAEFTGYDMSSLLNESDILAISLNLLSSNTYKSMPSGLSLLKESRHSNRATGTLRVNVLNIECLTNMYSDIFYVRNVAFRLSIQKTLAKLVVILQSAIPKYFCEADIELKVISPKGSCGFEQKSRLHLMPSILLGAKDCPLSGTSCMFIPWQLQDLNNKGVICDDSITLEVRVIIHSA